MEDHNHQSFSVEQSKLAAGYYRLRKNLRDIHGRPDLADEVRCYCLADSPADATHGYAAEGSGPNGETIVVLLKECHPEVCRIVVASPERNADMRKFYEEVVVRHML